MPTRRMALQRRYLSLGAGELIATLVFIAVAFVAVLPRVNDSGDRAALLAALIPLLMVLVQGGVYWLMARHWVQQKSMPANLAVIYRVFRVFDVVLLVASLSAIVCWSSGNIAAMVVIGLIWVFAVAEYVNYFVVRLAYPTGRWLKMVGQWRTPQLIQDMRRN